MLKRFIQDSMIRLVTKRIVISRYSSKSFQLNKSTRSANAKSLPKKAAGDQQKNYIYEK